MGAGFLHLPISTLQTVRGGACPEAGGWGWAIREGTGRHSPGGSRDTRTFPDPGGWGRRLLAQAARRCPDPKQGPHSWRLGEALQGWAQGPASPSRPAQQQAGEGLPPSVLQTQSRSGLPSCPEPPDTRKRGLTTCSPTRTRGWVYRGRLLGTRGPASFKEGPPSSGSRAPRPAHPGGSAVSADATLPQGVSITARHLTQKHRESCRFCDHLTVTN